MSILLRLPRPHRVEGVIPTTLRGTHQANQRRLNHLQAATEMMESWSRSVAPQMTWSTR